MPVYYDIAAAVHQHPGLGRYAASLGEALLATHRQDMSLVYYGGTDDLPPPEMAHVPHCAIRAGRKRWRMQVLFGHLVGARYDHLLRDAQLYHATEHLLMPLRAIPTVLTVHDLLFRRFPRYHKLQNYVYLNLAAPLFCRRADAVIAVSEHTKQDLVRCYGLAPERVTVIHEAADPRFRVPSAQDVEAVRARRRLPERYLMTLCAIEPRKNHAGFLRAFERLSREDGDLYWLIGGRKGWLYEGFFAALERSPARDRVILPGYVPDAELAAVYGGALAFVFPSFGEGFGLPLLEAMACGTPVVSSRATSLPEIGGDAARYFCPENVDEMAAVTREVLEDPALRAEMRARGLVRASCFSWQRAARETWSLYERVIDASR
jgi:glycosyltransferase involved in cell wall biosynthesis